MNSKAYQTLKNYLKCYEIVVYDNYSILYCEILYISGYFSQQYILQHFQNYISIFSR